MANSEPVPVQKMIDDVPNAKGALEDELAEAMSFVENNLRSGVAYITSGSVISPGIPRSQSLNWYLAVAGYKAWGKGLASVSCDGTCVLEFEYKVYDRYNFDGGKNADIHGGINVPDELLAEFHRQGLAREYDLIGTVKKTVSWKIGEKNPVIDSGWQSERRWRR